ncbi:MAG: Bax inhibitor-1/YccA family protein [Alphaproteobacteria bacterium]
MTEYQRRVSERLNQNELEGAKEGLSTFFSKVYAYMTFGLLITALMAYMISTSSEALSILYTETGFSIWGWIALLSPLAILLIFGGMIESASVGTLQIIFTLFSALMGISMSSIFLVYEMESICQVFLITAGTFAGMSIWGFVTKTDLTSMGSFLGMALWGLIIASVANFFFKSPQMYYIISYVGVIVFVGLTAYDTQKIKQTYSSYDDSSIVGKKALMGALTLYLDFINLFLYLLRILGKKK